MGWGDSWCGGIWGRGCLRLWLGFHRTCAACNSARSAAVSGVSLRFGMRHELGAGVAVGELWEDPVLILGLVAFNEVDDSAAVVWTSSCERAVGFRGHAGVDGVGLDAIPFAGECLACLCRWGKAWRLIICVWPDEVLCPSGIVAT